MALRPRRFRTLSAIKGHPRIVAGVAGAAVLLLALYAGRTSLAAFLVNAYLESQGVPSRIVVDSIGLDGVTAHGEIGRARAPDVTFKTVTVRFDTNKWLPQIIAVDIRGPILRVTVDRRGITFGSLQPWVDSQRVQSTSVGAFPSFVSRNLIVSVNNARVIATTIAGDAVVDADARIEGGVLQWADAHLHPALLKTESILASVKSASFHAVTVGAAIRVVFTLAGSAEIRTPREAVRLDNARLAFEVPELHWGNNSAGPMVWVPSAALTFDGALDHGAGGTPAPLTAHLLFKNLRAGLPNDTPDISGETSVEVRGSLPSREVTTLTQTIPLLSHDQRIVSAIVEATRSLALEAHVSWRTSHSFTVVNLGKPAELTGANGATVRLSPVPGHDTLRIGREVIASLVANLGGGGLPDVALELPQVVWSQSGPALDSELDLHARGDVGEFKGLMLNGRANIESHDGTLLVRLPQCAGVKLGAMLSNRKRVISHGSIMLCPVAGQPFFDISDGAWRFRAAANAASAVLDSAGLKTSGGNGEIAAEGNAGAGTSATMTVAATVSDASKSRRIAQQSLIGRIQLIGGVAQGQIDIAAGRRHTHIGKVVFTHRIQTGRGQANIEFPKVVFGDPGLQPSDISPILSQLAHSKGAASFAGYVRWTRKHVNSGGTLEVGGLQFTSPFGVAQELRTHLVFTSLLPPITAPDQEIDVARVDWASPLTAIKTLFSLKSSELHVDAAQTDVADGSIMLSPLTVNMVPEAVTASTVRLSHVNLGTLIDTSNLGSKMHISGRISGDIPFSSGPQGLRIADGHLESDGPGRLSIDPSLWGRGTPNAVEKLAYRALENLAFQSLSATVTSESGGRLRIVFHIKGYNDSPGPEENTIELFDLVQGKAFQKNIPLPRGTPIDLTLDVSLNFDELLHGYEQAWSQATAPPQ